MYTVWRKQLYIPRVTNQLLEMAINRSIQTSNYMFPAGAKCPTSTFRLAGFNSIWIWKSNYYRLFWVVCNPALFKFIVWSHVAISSSMIDDKISLYEPANYNTVQGQSLVWLYQIHCLRCVKKLSNIYETSSIQLGAFKKVTTPVTLREGDTYMSLWTRSCLVPEMAYKLCGAMPSPTPIMTCGHLGHREQT